MTDTAPEIPDDDEAPSDEEEYVVPEPKVLGFLNQDNVSTPGVQTTTHIDGSVHEHGEPIPDEADPEPVEAEAEADPELVVGEPPAEEPAPPAEG